MSEARVLAPVAVTTGCGVTTFRGKENYMQIHVYRSFGSRLAATL
jgi:hypothetical protein